ncbi:DUF523 domain-containing protein [Thermodesulfobacterium hydrogeniphilum]|uniref:DUF523 domain-containing protein n=1 Tax=Thermodesulfobacterium hydrogeniphilum TaxID=161156 RepID=UPI0006908569|nr:DUF523 domain-containing protein [Thermodesulfobacterium hydrogeniphilum]
MAGRNLVVISACLLGENTRFDGTIKSSPIVCEIAKYCKVIKICPEVAIGFPVPRPRVFLYDAQGEFKVIQEGTKKDLTKEIENFCINFLTQLPPVDAFILKSKSPSCSPSPTTKFYKDLEGKELIGRTYGIMGRLIPEFFPQIPVIDELSLKGETGLKFLKKLFGSSIPNSILQLLQEQ